MKPTLFLFACAGIFMSAYADAAVVRAALLVTATTISTATPTDDHILSDMDADSFEIKDSDSMPQFQSSNADQTSHADEEAFRRKLLEHLRQLTIPAHAPYFISIEESKETDEDSRATAFSTIYLRY